MDGTGSDCTSNRSKTRSVDEIDDYEAGMKNVDKVESFSQMNMIRALIKLGFYEPLI